MQMADNNTSTEYEVKAEKSGKISFNSDVIATIAALAAIEVPGVAGMSGGFTAGVAELLGRKNLTKGVKVEVGSEECAIDLNLVVKYGSKIHEVCQSIQQAVKGSVEMMTGLRVVEVNVHVQGVDIDKKEIEAQPTLEQLEAANKDEQPPARVR
jgi:uncharacterized alkaline shock family protein YloU